MLIGGAIKQGNILLVVFLVAIPGVSLLKNILLILQAVEICSHVNGACGVTVIDIVFLFWEECGARK
jgi:hypothetical protein